MDIMEASPERLEQRIQTLAAISEPCEAGTQRQSYTEAYKAGVRQVRAWMEETNLTVWEDGVGNLFGRLVGQETLPELLSGSHLDTVRCAGAYDGIAGVICALEVAQMIQDSGKKLRHPYTVLGTVGEEGTRFGQVLLGSQFLTGVFGERELDTLVGIEDGKTLRQAFGEYGLSGDISQVPLQHIRAVVELHGEQGPVLEGSGDPIGIVRTIAGIAWLEVTVTGQAGHSGTVPMDVRRDAGLMAYEMILHLNQYVTERYCGRATLTAGQLRLEPGSSNCIPGKCVFTLDIRSGSEEILNDILRQVDVLAGRMEQVTVQTMSRRLPVPMDEGIQRAMEAACRQANVSFRYLDSGAGHDAMVFAKKWPTAMLFLPNRGGISHNPLEYIAPEHLKTGAEILYRTIRILDERED